MMVDGAPAFAVFFSNICAFLLLQQRTAATIGQPTYPGNKCAVTEVTKVEFSGRRSAIFVFQVTLR
jgi:hypothetical protein